MAKEVLSDSEIAELIGMAKRLPHNWHGRAISRSGQIQAQIDLYGADGTLFRVVARQSIRYRNNFSVILAVQPVGIGQINLLRYDGSNHPHHNKIEGNRIMYKPHIHKATERYQLLRRAEPEGYAEETDRYHDISGAWECLLVDANLQAAESGEDMSLPKPFMEG